MLARDVGLLQSTSRCAIDATGFESHHISRHFVNSGARTRYWSSYPKLTVATDVRSHLWIGAYTCQGPCNDSPQFTPVIEQAARLQRIEQVLGDRAYDAEHHHRLCRETLAIPSTIIPVRRKHPAARNRSWPSTPYRREMKRSANREGYGQRWQAESAFSRHKRLFGSSLRARRWPMQAWELSLRVLSHNVRLIAAT